MDSLTQIVLGAGVAEACVGKKIGNRAILWGAILGTVPDLDVFIQPLYDTVDAMYVHRAFSHSLLFFVLAAPVFGWLLGRIYKRSNVSFRSWTIMSFLVLFTHAILDCFTTWGTKLFYPFSTYPVAFKTIFVIDPMYTLPFLICVILVMTIKREKKLRQRINTLGLVLSTLYLGLTVVNQQLATSSFKASLERQGIEYVQMDVKPGALQNVLWVATVERENDYLIGYRSFLDQRAEVEFRSHPKHHELLEPVLADGQVAKLIRLFDGYHTAEVIDGKLVINDLRFGQYAGWLPEGGGFVFSFELEGAPPEPVMVTRRPDNTTAFRAMLGQWWSRVKGI